MRSPLSPSLVLRASLAFAALSPVASAQNQTWIRQFGTSVHDSANASAPDGSGGVYVVGDSAIGLGGPPAGNGDVWLAHHDAAGGQTWIRQVSIGNTGASIWSQNARAAAPDGMGGVFIGGAFSASGSWLARHDTAGDQAWLRHFDSVLFPLAYGVVTGVHINAVAADGIGGVYVAGKIWGSVGAPGQGGPPFEHVWLARCDSAGNLSWFRTFGLGDVSAARAATLDGVGGVFIAGSFRPLSSQYAFVARYDSAGNQSWVRSLSSFTGSPGEEALAATSDGAGGVYVSGWTSADLGGPSSGGDDAWLAHYDGSGNQTWIQQFGSGNYDRALASAPDGSGGVYVAGSTQGSLGGPTSGTWDVWFARYDSAGNQTSIHQFGSSGWDLPHAASSDGAGGLYLSGATSGGLGGSNAGDYDVWLARYGDLEFSRYCTPAVANSTGVSSMISAAGSNLVQENDVTLLASHLPLNSFGIFLTSRDQGNVFPVSNSQGRLCLGGFIGRYIGPGQVQQSGPAGTFSLTLDLMSMAHPFSPVVAQAGQTWYFQAWHRDFNPALTSNFTDALSITFE